MKFDTPRKRALAVGLGILTLAIGLRFAGVARPILTLLHLLSLAACGAAIVVRGTPTPK